jgi:hypothetical protein
MGFRAKFHIDTSIGSKVMPKNIVIIFIKSNAISYSMNGLKIVLDLMLFIQSQFFLNVYLTWNLI